MARRPRGVITEAFVHVAARGNRGFPIYVGRRDYEFFLEHLRGYAEKHSVRVHAFCLMTNHFHLLLEAGEVPVSKCNYERFMTGSDEEIQYTNLRLRGDT